MKNYTAGLCDGCGRDFYPELLAVLFLKKSFGSKRTICQMLLGILPQVISVPVGKRGLNAHYFIKRETRKVCKGRVDIFNRPIGIDDHDRVKRMFQNAAGESVVPSGTTGAHSYRLRRIRRELGYFRINDGGFQ